MSYVCSANFSDVSFCSALWPCHHFVSWVFWLFIYFHILLRKGESTFVFGLAVLVVWRRLPASVIRVLGLSVYHHQGFQWHPVPVGFSSWCSGYMLLFPNGFSYVSAYLLETKKFLMLFWEAIPFTSAQENILELKCLLYNKEELGRRWKQEDTQCKASFSCKNEFEASLGNLAKLFKVRTEEKLSS